MNAIFILALKGKLASNILFEFYMTYLNLFMALVMKQMNLFDDDLT